MRSRISSVRIAAAQGGLRSGLGEESSALLAAELDADDEWVRLLAANALDGAGEYARPHIANLRKALTDPRNQTRYVARVVNQTLNDLLETANQVP